MELLLYAAGPVVGGLAVYAWLECRVANLRAKLNGARNDNSRLRRERNEAVEELGFARAQIEADAKYVDLDKRRAATRAKQNAKARAATAAKQAGRVA